MSDWLCKPLANDFTKQAQTYYPATVTAHALPREVVRCHRCHLVQFRPVSDLCRRCATLMPSPPQMYLGLPGKQIVFEGKAVGSESTSSNHCACENVCYSPPNLARRLGVGSRLKKLREHLGLKQQEIAARAGLTRTYISRIENSRLLPGPAIVQRLAGALAVEIKDLLAEDGNGNQSPLSEENLFWSSMIRHFPHLQPEQMSIVLSRVRNMVVQGSQRKEMVL